MKTACRLLRKSAYFMVPVYQELPHGSFCTSGTPAWRGLYQELLENSCFLSDYYSVLFCIRKCCFVLNCIGMHCKIFFVRSYSMDVLWARNNGTNHFCIKNYSVVLFCIRNYRVAVLCVSKYCCVSQTAAWRWTLCVTQFQEFVPFSFLRCVCLCLFPTR
jgi:hypothetical protein